MSATMTAPHCARCSRDCELTNGFEIYPHRADLAENPIWICRGCKARVGCHPGTTNALGLPADSETRRARSMLHNALLDPLWRHADRSLGPHGQRRKRVYRFLGDRLGIPYESVHVGNFDIETCRRAWLALKGVTYQQVHEWREAQKRGEQGP